MNKPQNNKAAALRTAMQTLDPATYQEIRDAFHAIGDHLKPLADALENADADVGPEGPLLEEHYLFIQMYDLLRKSNLGAAV
ncbi:hypothetical protein FYK55_18280 [Roseiconus nitratireducens]|uniref:Uncharacterized protein n=1 Tax=Roseiconus nitratireducens TaxID=2605748 RepID=A0A5M6D8J5_9BACT|nr:hypothetical protein [Roseiconus nitratireducens]KAA5541505.1 hypothetical protein FYK55_18280 [Roseiconus nitratireducens]